MRQWNGIAFFTALVVVAVAAKPLHGALGDAAYFLDLLLFVACFVVLRYLFGRL